MDGEELLDWLKEALEEAEQGGKVDLEDLNLGDDGITVETAAGVFLISVTEL